MKIIIPLAGSFGPQGGFRVLSELANNWLRRGHEVEFLVYQNFTKPYFPTKAKMIKYDGTGKLILGENNKNDFQFLGTFQLRWAMERALSQLTADIVLATQCFTAGPVWKSKIKAKKVYYIQAYEPEFYNGNSLKLSIFKFIAKKSYTYPLEKIVNSEMYFDYKEIKSDKVVFPGLDFELFFPKEQNFEKKSKYVIGTVGRLEKIKGTQYILEAFEILRNKYKNQVELHVAFGNEQWNEFEGVKVIRPKNDKELGNFYRDIDIYVCAGNAQLQAVHYPVIESMSCKTPLITTGYYPANENNSYLVEINDSLAIVKAIEKIINNPEMATQKANIALKEVQQFDWKKVSEKMINYFIEMK